MPTTEATPTALFRGRYTSTVAWAAGVLLFLLPFVEIRCNGNSFARNSGLGLAIGRDFKVSSLKGFGEELDIETATNTKATSGSGRVYPFALAALALGVIGLLLSLMKRKPGAINTVVGALAVAAMMAMFIDIKSDINKEVKKAGGLPADTDLPLGNFFKETKITVAFTPWFYLSAVSLLAAAFFSYRNSRPEAVSYKETPPPHAPQVPLNNPGDQSNFPSAPSESEIG